MNDFERAIALSLDPYTSHENRQQATNYLNALQHSDQSWELALTVLQTSKQENVAFAAWNLLCSLVENDRIPGPNRESVRQWILKYLRDTASQQLPNNIANKIATVLVVFCKMDYPHAWPSFFSDLVTLLQFGPRSFDTFFRVLNYFDEDLIVYSERRSVEEVTQITKIKDHMRANGTLVRLAEVWYDVLERFHATQPDLVATCLQTISLYLGWMEVALVLNERFLALFNKFVTDPNLRVAALKCLRSFIRRRVPIEEQLEMFRRSQLVDVLTRIDCSQDAKLAAVVANLAAAIGETLVAVCEEAPQQMTAELQTWLQACLKLSYAFGAHESFKVSSEVMVFLQKYSEFIFSEKRRASLPHDQLLLTFQRLFQVIFSSIRFPVRYNHADPDQYEEQFDLHRVKVNNLFTSLLYKLEEPTLTTLKDRLTELLTHIGQANFADVEATLYMISHAGSKLRLSSIKESFQKGGLYYQLIELVMTGKALECSHSTIYLLYFSLVQKFGNLFIGKNPDSLKTVLQSFLNGRGIQHSDPLIRSKACFHLLRLVEQLSPKMRAELAKCAQEIIRYVHTIFLSFVNEEKIDVSNEDFLNICRLIGGLSTVALIGKDASFEVISSCLQPMQTRLATMVQTQQLWSTKHAVASGNRVADLCRGIASLSKHLVKDSNHLTDIFLESLKTVLSALAVIPAHEELRASVLMLTHHLLPSAKKKLFPILPTMLDTYLCGVNATTIEGVVQFVQRLMSSFKTDLSEFIDSVFLKVVAAIFSCNSEFSLPQNGHVNGTAHNGASLKNGSAQSHVLPEAAVSQLKAGQLMMYKHFYAFLSSVVKSSLTHVLTSKRNAPHLLEVFQSLIKGTSVADLSVNISCYEIFRYMVEAWDAFQSVAGFYEVFITNITEACFKSMKASHVSPDDAASNRLYREVASLQIVCRKRFDNAGYTQVLSSKLQSQLPFVDAATSQQYCVLVANGGKALEAGMRDLAKRAEQFATSQAPNR